ncbi:MAG: glutamyl-tRNA reductase [Actinobacteria bacterium]|nr:MAG: glutamyl-tRNA reductase [Actinomycetota bacterium]
MHLTVIGLSHRTAPVEIREKLSFPEREQEDALLTLMTSKQVLEALILSTCNRTEVYAVVTEEGRGKDAVIDFLCDYKGLQRRRLDKHLYSHDSANAVRHLLRVVSSLDSMVIGEAQILGQVKEAYGCALEAGTTSTIFNKLFRHSFEVGKRVRTDTEIGESAVSISYSAVELAKKVFGSLSGRSVLILGAGKMSELTVKHLVANGVVSVVVSNRNYDRAVELAKRIEGEAIRFDDRGSAFASADIVISSTGASHYVVHKSDVEKAMHARRHRPIFFIDIAVPRDIEPEVNDIDNVFLYDIDDLQSVVDSNLAERMREAEKAEAIVDKEIDNFIKWLSTLEVVPTITALREKAERIREAEVEKALNKLGELSERDVNTINALTTGIVNKLLHAPIVKVKEHCATEDSYSYVESLRYLFNLDAAEGEKPHKWRTAESLARRLTGRKQEAQ